MPAPNHSYIFIFSVVFPNARGRHYWECPVMESRTTLGVKLPNKATKITRGIVFRQWLTSRLCGFVGSVTSRK